MTKELAAGIKNRIEITVDDSKTAISAGSGTLPVFGTPFVAALMEQTAEESVRPCLDDGQATVGTKLELNHTAATVVGRVCWCESELTLVDRRRLVFNLAVFDDGGQVADCKHERFIIDALKFMDKANKRGAKE